jgi:hypothetical protein
MRCNTDNLTFSYRFISFISHQIPNNYPFPYRFHYFGPNSKKKHKFTTVILFFFVDLFHTNALGKKKKLSFIYP